MLVELINFDEFKEISNVTSYIHRQNPEKWELQIDTTDTTDTTDINTYSENIYFINENCDDTGFIHWIAESAIFLPEYIEFKKKYPNIKIHCNKKRNYKTLLYNKFNITDNDISFNLELPNKCIIVPYHNLYVKHNKYIVNFNNNLSRLVSYLAGNINPIKDIPILFLPRQVKDNYGGNNRTINYTDIYTNVINNGGTILNTDNITDIDTQINYIKAAKILILDHGSSYLFNGIFAKDSKIILLNANSTILDSYKEFVYMNALEHRIVQNNNIYPISNSFYTWQMIKQIINTF